MRGIINFFNVTFIDLARQFRLSYLPPLMIYVAAGVSGLTGIVGTFFVKDYLNLSAAFLAGLGFWGLQHEDGCIRNQAWYSCALLHSSESLGLESKKGADPKSNYGSSLFHFAF